MLERGFIKASHASACITTEDIPFKQKPRVTKLHASITRRIKDIVVRRLGMANGIFTKDEAQEVTDKAPSDMAGFYKLAH